MPFYTFRDRKTDEAFDLSMPYSELAGYLEANPHLYHSMEKMTVGGYAMEVSKAVSKLPQDYKEKLRRLKKAYTTRTKKSTINDNI